MCSLTGLATVPVVPWRADADVGPEPGPADAAIGAPVGVAGRAAIPGDAGRVQRRVRELRPLRRVAVHSQPLDRAHQAVREVSLSPPLAERVAVQNVRKS